MSRTVVMVGFPGSQVLDVTGPLEVLSTANRRLEALSSMQPRYDLKFLSVDGTAVLTTSGLELGAHGAVTEAPQGIDTLFVPGGEGTRAALQDTSLVAWIRRSAQTARRVASVCTGAFLLAEAGVLDGRRATTHWSMCEDLARLYPRVGVEPDSIHVKDGNVYSSAGVTAGIDLALALVEEDQGREIALHVARQMVVFLKRPGGQSQFSAQLRAQLAERAPLRALQTWILSHLASDLSVRELSRRAGMSPRNFARAFKREVGTTPARFVETARVDLARRLLEETQDSVEAIAQGAGFGSAESMRKAFLRQIRVSPAGYRARFACCRSSRHTVPPTGPPA